MKQSQLGAQLFSFREFIKTPEDVRTTRCMKEEIAVEP